MDHPIIKNDEILAQEPEKAYVVMMTEQWVFDQTAPDFETAIDEEVARVAADLKDYFMALYLKRRNGDV